MFSAFQTFGKLGALASSVARAWSPLALWPDGIATPGMWISPRTLTSEWQDYTGTTPVSVPGTVADSSNPVGLALDIRAGAPEVLGPELVVNGSFSGAGADWTIYSNAENVSFANNRIELISAGDFFVGQAITGLDASKRYYLEWDQECHGTVYLRFGNNYTNSYSTPGNGHRVVVLPTSSSPDGIYILQAGWSVGDWVDNISVKEIPGNHMLQSTSTSRPLLSAYDGQTLGPGDTYDGTGYPIAQLYDGVDDGMATATFSAGTLTSAMDCMIVVRRDSAAHMMCSLFDTAGARWFGAAEAGSGALSFDLVGTPTVHVDKVQLAGGTAVTRGTVAAALTVGDWHILEYQDLDMSGFGMVRWGDYPVGFSFIGARGDIMLYPSTTSTEDKDAARQWLANYYGVTLP